MQSVVKGDICPQCKGNNTDISVEPTEFTVVLQCLACGFLSETEMRHTKDGEKLVVLKDEAGQPIFDTRVLEGHGAFLIATVNDEVHTGRLETSWSDIHEGYFEQVFNSDEVDYGYVTRWVDGELETVYQIEPAEQAGDDKVLLVCT